jgi:hypothetical protein
MNEFAGSAMYLAWVWSGGTVQLETKFRNFSWKPTLEWIDASGGSDAFEVMLPGIGRGSDIPYTRVMPEGTAGTALLGAVATRNEGTLIYGPAGTATGNPKFEIPAVSGGPAIDQPYDDVVILTVNFRQNADETVGAF